MERYTKICDLSKNLNSEDCPIIISTGALLKDNKKEVVLTQLKFTSASDKKIIAISVSVKAFDACGKELKGVKDYKYLDLNIDRNESFGSDKGIPMPDSATRDVKVLCTSITYGDNSTWQFQQYGNWSIYTSALNIMSNATSEKDFLLAADEFKKISDYKDANELAAQCVDKAEICRKDAIYSSAKSKMTVDKISSYEEAILIFQSVSGWKDADEQVIVCHRKIDEIKAKEEEKRIADEKAKKKLKKILSIATPIMVTCIAFIIVLTNIIIPNQKYSKAMGMIDSGNYEEAYVLLEEIGNTEAIASSKYDRAMSLISSEDYESAYALLEEIGNTEAISSSKYDRAMNLIDSEDYVSAYKLLYGLSYKNSEKLLQQINFDVGDTIYFGSYEQDNNLSNGKERIKWLVLDVKGDKMLLISDKVLDCKQYNASPDSVSWDSCSLRFWLNSDFLNSAFSIEDQALIENTKVSADNNPEYNTDPGKVTTDKVFLLSVSNVEEYITSFNDRKCAPSEYAIAQGVNIKSGNTKDGMSTCCWWLRSPGFYQHEAAIIRKNGSLEYSGYRVNHTGVGVRPALWINLES